MAAGCICWLSRRGKILAAQVSVRGKEKLLSIGVYPEISLAGPGTADAARKLLAHDVDPGRPKRRRRRPGSPRRKTAWSHRPEWYAAHSPTWASSHADTTRRRLRRRCLSRVGGAPDWRHQGAEVLAMLRRIESRGALASGLQSDQGHLRAGLPVWPVTGRADTATHTADLKGP